MCVCMCMCVCVCVYVCVCVLWPPSSHLFVLPHSPPPHSLPLLSSAAICTYQQLKDVAMVYSLQQIQVSFRSDEMKGTKVCAMNSLPCPKPVTQGSECFGHTCTMQGSSIDWWTVGMAVSIVTSRADYL